MKINNLQENFLAYLEGVLSDNDKIAFENQLNIDSGFKQEYLEFVETYNSLLAMKNESKAPEGFDLEVMKAIRKVSPVNRRSSIMKKINKRFFLTLVPTFAMCILVLYSVKQAQHVDNKLLSHAPEEISTTSSSNTDLIVESRRKIPQDKNLTTTATNDSSTPPIILDSAEINAPKQRVRSEKRSDSVLSYTDTNTGAKRELILRGSKWEIDRSFSEGAPAPAGTYTTQLSQANEEENYKSVSSENYNPISENAFLEAIKNPLSTFSIDVDTGSYANVRRFLNSSTLPPKDSIRIEEMLNYFKYDYKGPASKDTPFSVSTELSFSPWNNKFKLLQIGLKGYEEDIKNLPASNLVFLIDVSGSMSDQNKLPLLKQGFKLLVENLDSKDRVAIVVYAGAAGVVLDSKDGSNKAEIIAALDRLEAGGSTAGGQGIELAYQIANQHFIKGGNNRVILATDGDFNVGISNQAELVKMIEEKRKSGIFLSVLGFGTGNYQEGMMEQLANKGNGNYSYIDNIREAKKVLVNDLKGTLFTIAKDVKIQIEFNPTYVKAYRLVGYENRTLNKEDFNDDRKDAGELGAGHSVTALYEIVPVGVEFNETPNVDELKYKKVAASPTSETVEQQFLNNELATIKLRYKLPNEDKSKLITHIINDKAIDLSEASENFRFASSVASFGMLLRDSEFKGNATFESIEEQAKNAIGRDELGYRAEFLKLIETAKLLKK